MRNAASVEIDRPIDDVFRLTNDHVAQWSIIVVEDEILDKKPEGVGTTFRTVTEENGWSSRGSSLVMNLHISVPFS